MDNFFHRNNNSEYGLGRIKERSFKLSSLSWISFDNDSEYLQEENKNCHNMITLRKESFLQNSFKLYSKMTSGISRFVLPKHGKIICDF